MEIEEASREFDRDGVLVVKRGSASLIIVDGILPTLMTGVRKDLPCSKTHLPLLF
jgi:hypothetical protein